MMKLKLADYHRYPTVVRWSANLLAFGLLLVSAAEYLLSWLRAFARVLSFPWSLSGSLPASDEAIVHALLVSHLGLLAAVVLARAIVFLAPDVRLEENGMLFQTRLGRRLIPYADLLGVHSVEVTPSERFVVWVECKRGLPLQGWWASLLFERFLRDGFLITSDLSGFDAAIGRIVAHLQHRYGEAEFAAHFSEETPSWLLAMILIPEETLHRLIEATPLPIDRRTAAWQMVSAIGALVLPLAVGAVIHLQFPWGVLILPLVAIWEWPLASLFLTAVPIGETRRIEFEEALLIYPFTQLPRWLAGTVLTFFVVAGSPGLFYLPVLAGALILDCWWVVILTEEWFSVELPEALVAALLTAIYQMIVLGVFMALLPR